MATSGNEDPGDSKKSRSFAGGGVERRYSDTGYLSWILYEKKFKNKNE